jgi:hypothetical protein
MYARWHYRVFLAWLLAGPALLQGAPPITTLKTPAGDLLRQWAAEGTAAGNDGDYYDNRDRGHSDLRTDPYPQLQRIQYTADDRKTNRDWAFQGRVLPHVVFGNSSTSAGATTGGSNPRMGYSHPRGLELLYQQYTHNNLYIYPEHRDHKPGHNGRGQGSIEGYGDLYPTNTPYLIISQGSSGSDQPFMRAIPLTLAAFRPEVKKKLVEKGLLAPALQLILRQTSKRLDDPQQYLTGKAHPTVFEGPWVDDLKMVKMAHEIRLETIPPMVQLRVVEEDEAVPGRDYFDLYPHESLGHTPSVIARIHRHCRQQYRMVVSAESSYDVNHRPLEFRWVLLQGDPQRIHLAPQGKTHDRCEICANWHDRRPIAEGSPLESNRVEIGVFADNGKYLSAPAFVTFFYPDDEARTYAGDGRVLEIGYGLGEARAAVSDWKRLAELLDPKADGLAARLLKRGLSSVEIPLIRKAIAEYGQRQAEAAALVKSPAEPKPQQKAAEAARKAAADVLEKKREGLKAPLKELIETALRDLAACTTFYPDNSAAIAGLLKTADAGQRAAVENARRRLTKFHVLDDAAGTAWKLRPLREGSAPAEQRLTRYEQALVEQFNAEVLGRLVFAGIVNVSYARNYVDVRLALPKTWRDVYQYGPQGECLGWLRYDGEGTTEFNREGLLVLEKDAQGRPTKTQVVHYEWEDSRKDPRQLPAGRLKVVPGPAVER